MWYDTYEQKIQPKERDPEMTAMMELTDMDIKTASINMQNILKNLKKNMYIRKEKEDTKKKRTYNF